MLGRGFKWFINFWRSCWQWTLGKQGELATMITIIFAILASIGVTGSIFAIVQQNYNLFFMLIPLGVWFFLVAPVVVWKKEREKVLKYESDQIEFVVEDTDEFVRLTNDGMLCRIGVKSKGINTVSGVSVFCKGYDGNKNAFSDSALNPSGCCHGELSTVDVNYGTTKYFEVIIFHKESNKMWICYHYNKQLRMINSPSHMLIPNEIPSQDHNITLIASGNNIKAIDDTFSLRLLKDGKLEFRRLNEQGNKENKD